MWLYPLLLVLVVLAIVGGTLAGGVYTIVLIPLAVIAVVTWGVSVLWGRATGGSQSAGTEAPAAQEPLPHQQPRRSGRAPTTPAGLADARRREQ